MTLLARSFLRGIGSVIDISPTTDYSKGIQKGSDLERLSSDWVKIGEDLNRAIKKNEKTIIKHEASQRSKHCSFS